MTEQYQQYIGGDPEVYEEGNAWEGEPIPVHDVSERRTPELASTMTWPIPGVGAGQPVQILQRTVHRFKAKVTVNTLAGGSIVFSNTIDRLQGPTPQGATYTPTAFPSFLPDWESQQPLYAICTTGGTATVSVQDERYLESGG
jgi:hypothetical protein